jgi:thioredoxin-related protein
MEKGEGLELARKFNVQAYPTLFFINSKGDIIKTVIGYQTADQLIQQAKSIQ